MAQKPSWLAKANTAGLLLLGAICIGQRLGVL